MRPIRFVLPAMFFLAISSLFVTAADPATAPAAAQSTGTVQLQVLDPEGHPIANTRLQLSAHVAPVTDATGIARFQWPTGPQQIFVPVPGRGYGVTGITEVLPGQTAIAPLPRLVPYATVSGSVPDGAAVQILARQGEDTFIPRAVADRTGHFTLQLIDGPWHIIAQRNGKTVATLRYGLILCPGDSITGLQLRPVAPPAPSPPPPPDASQPAGDDQPQPQEPQTVWAHGTVRDEAGHPVAGAAVYGIVVFDDGHGGGVATQKALTDQRGSYAIHGGVWFGSFASFKVVAVKTPMPPAVCDCLSLEWTPDSTTGIVFPRAPTDIVLAARGGSLDVTTFLDGKPKPGATVRLTLLGSGFFGFEYGDVGQVYDLLNPSAITGPDGVAHFTHLMPGLYDLSAREDTKWGRSNFVDNEFVQIPSPIACAKSIPVRAGETTAQRIDLYKMPVSCPFQIFRPDGKPVSGTVAGGGRLFGQQDNWGHITSDEQNGIFTREFDRVGIWRNKFRYGIMPGASTQHAPYYEAAVYAAASPRLAYPFPVHATAAHVPNATASIQLLDPSGKPIRGYVGFGNMIGSTDDQGRIEFDGIESNGDGDDSVEPQAWTADPRRRNIELTEDAPLPPDAELSDRLFFPAQYLQTSPGQHLNAVIQAVPAGYVRGICVPAKGHPLSQYAPPQWTDEDAKIDYRPDTGEFIAGPMKAETCHLEIWPSDIPDSKPIITPITIRGGGAVVLPPIHLPFPLPTQAAVPEDYGEQRIEAHIFQSDAKAPAYAATLTNFIAGQDLGTDWMNPYPGATTDAGGDVITDIDRAPATAEQNPARSYLVAMQPGVCGATVIDATADIKQPLSITLPPPIAASGKLTLDGKSLTGQTGQFRVLAAYQGKGELNALLSVWATPQPDGSFELAGLTPGTYKIQASLDNIWLSDSVTLVAGDKPLPPIHLDIPAPGGPAVIHVASAKGKPLCGIQVVVDRPAGPLTELDWPAAFTTDGAGDAWIPALEAGKHTARLRDNSAAVEFVIPPLPAAAAVEVKLAAKSP